MARRRESITVDALPHLVEAIVAAAEYDLLISFRATCKSLKEMSDKRLAEHVKVDTIEGQFKHCSGRKLPFMMDPNAREMHQGDGSWRSQVRVLDLSPDTSYPGEHYDNYFKDLTGLRMVRLIADTDSCVRKHSNYDIISNESISPITLVVFGCNHFDCNNHSTIYRSDWIRTSPVAKVVYHVPNGGYINTRDLESITDLVLVIKEMTEGCLDEVMCLAVTDIALNIFAPDNLTIVINEEAMKEDIAHYRKLVAEEQEYARADHSDSFSVPPFCSTITVITLSEYRAMSDPKEYCLEMCQDTDAL